MSSFGINRQHSAAPSFAWLNSPPSSIRTRTASRGVALQKGVLPAVMRFQQDLRLEGQVWDSLAVEQDQVVHLRLWAPWLCTTQAQACRIAARRPFLPLLHVLWHAAGESGVCAPPAAHHDRHLESNVLLLWVTQNQDGYEFFYVF